MPKAFVSIIIPCKGIDEYTKECISCCGRLEYDNFEIILLPDSCDQSMENVRIIPTGEVSPGVKRNIGVIACKGEFCAFIDSDAYPRKDWLKNAIEYFENSEVGAVGGPGLTPESDDLMQKAGGLVLSSFMVGNLSSRYKRKRSFESDDIHSCNFITKKSLLEATEGWNEKYWPGEDTLMCLAIKALGKKLIESSDVVVYHHRRPLFRQHLKQVSRFGEHRGFFARKFPKNSRKITYFFPSLLLVSFLISILLSVTFAVFAYVTLSWLIAYLILSMVASLQFSGAKLVFPVWTGIIVTHFVYGIFFLKGLTKRDLKK